MSNDRAVVRGAGVALVYVADRRETVVLEGQRANVAVTLSLPCGGRIPVIYQGVTQNEDLTDTEYEVTLTIRGGTLQINMEE